MRRLLLLLSLLLTAPAGAFAVQPTIAVGGAEFGIDWLPSLLATRDKGGDIVNIAQVFARSGMTEVTWKDSGIESVADMKGKKVGVWCCGNEFELFAALTKNGIDPKNSDEVTIVNQPFDSGSLFQKVRGKALPEWAAEFDAGTWAQFFLKYCISHPAVTCVIPGTSQVRHLEDNLGAARGRLPDAAMRRRIEGYWDSRG